MSVYSKPVLTIDQQIHLLESRGLNILDKDKARHSLQFINYYRFSGYTISFEQIINGKRSHQFRKDITFEDVLALYDFDRHLRVLVMGAIERIEVAIRTQICLHKSLPSWMITELLSMGAWSIVYQNLENRSDKKRISDVFKLSPPDFESWLHTLTYIRNLCAHHSRLWNRQFTIRPKQANSYFKYLNPNTTFAAQAAMIHLFLKIISPDNQWTTRLCELLEKNTFVNPSKMGFSADWKSDVFWGIKS